MLTFSVQLNLGVVVPQTDLLRLLVVKDISMLVFLRYSILKFSDLVLEYVVLSVLIVFDLNKLIIETLNSLIVSVHFGISFFFFIL